MQQLKNHKHFKYKNMKTVNTFTSELEYQEAKHKYNAYHNATMQYCKENKTNGIPTEITKTFPFAEDVTNDLRSKIETYEFMNDIPDKYFIYINDKERIATTWTGDFLGHVSFGNEYKDNFGGKRQSIWIVTANRVKYYGTYFKSSGDYARITKRKHQ